MPELTFNVGGRIVSKREMQARKLYEKPKPKPKADEPDSYHNGWAVEGYAPGTFEAAMKLAREAFASWCEKSPEAQAKAIRNGTKPPQEWSEVMHVRKVKRKRVRSKPYEVESAAAMCMELAGRQGWTHLQIVELKAGEKPAGLL